MPVITLLTDFGTADGYGAAMKGVIRSITPDVVLDDASHDIPPGDVLAAAWILGAYWQLYPRGSIHLIVVDPGVGTARRALAADIDGRIFVAPDNGVLTRVLADCRKEEARVIEITNGSLSSDGVSATFHGRDIFAPAAARLAAGAALDELGTVIHDPVLLQLPEPFRDGSSITGEVIHVDRYGNLVTNIPAKWVTPGAAVRVGSHALPVVRSYSDVPHGAPLALIGSRGLLEISVRDGDASFLLGRVRGSTLVVTGSGISH